MGYRYLPPSPLVTAKPTSARAKRSAALAGRVQGRTLAVGDIPTICQKRATRRSAILSTGHGGLNGVRQYSRRSPEGCK